MSDYTDKLGASVNIYSGIVGDNESKNFSHASGILIVGDRYYGAGIYNVGYSDLSLIGGRDHGSNISKNGYNLTLSGACSYVLFNSFNA